MKFQVTSKIELLFWMQIQEKASKKILIFLTNISTYFRHKADVSVNSSGLHRVWGKL